MDKSSENKLDSQAANSDAHAGAKNEGSHASPAEPALTTLSGRGLTAADLGAPKQQDRKSVV